MNYLKEEYWKNFQKVIKDINGKEKIIRDGSEFENLVEDLLKLMYHNQSISWKRTNATHDGNKDFWGEKEDGSIIWAECKNYSDKLSLKIIAPTLVMAELGDIQEILVFSYSAINFPTKEKLLYYANKREKKIYFYDDSNLENLLFKFRTNLFPKYFKEFSESCMIPQMIQPYVFSCSIPGISYNNAAALNTNVFHVKLNELFCVGIGIINNSYLENLQVELSFDKFNDLDYLEVVDSSVKNSTCKKWNKTINIAPGEAIFCKLYFKTVRFKKEFRLPTIKLHFDHLEIRDVTIEFKKIICNYLFCTPVIGSKYLNALKELNSLTINRGSISIAIFYGKSGVGKSRLLQESLSIYARHHYHILNFTMDALTKDSFLMMREIICFLYNLTPELVVESLKEYREETTILGIKELEILTLLQALLDDNHKKFYHLLNKYKIFIFEKILSQKNVLIIDNIQFAEPFFVDFLYDLVVYGKNYQHNTQMVLVLSYNEDYYCSSSVKKLKLFAEELKGESNINVFLHEVEGMGQNQLSLGFLKELIHVTTEKDDLFLDMIVKKANHVPKHIENIVEYLLRKQALNIENNYFIIKNPNIFYNSIEELPESFADIFALRYKLFLSNEKLTDEEVILVIAAIHFWGQITKEQLDFFQLDKTIVYKLEQYGFVSTDNTNIYSFNHDLYEQYFTNRYSLEDCFLTYIVKRQYDKQCIFSIWQNILILIKRNTCTSKELSHIIRTWINTSVQVPYKLKKYFYKQLIQFLTINYEEISNFDEYMECIKKICLEVKNSLGTNSAKVLFESVYSIVENKSIEEREASVGYQHFINEYCENLLQSNDCKVISIYKERTAYLSQHPEKNYNLLARLYNRIYVYYKNSKKEIIVHKYLEKSISICKEQHLIGLEIENLYDEGNYYLFVPEMKEYLIKCWSKGYQLFKEHRVEVEYLTLNSFKKKIQLELLCNEYADIENTMESAFEYIETGKYSQQTLFFNASLYFLKAIYGLMSHQLEITEIQEALDLAAKYYGLKNNETPFTIHFLYAKLAFYREEFQEMLLQYDYALQRLKKSNYYYKHIEKIIANDCSYKIGLIKGSKKDIELNYEDTLETLRNACQRIESLSTEELSEYINTFCSVSNITDETGKDGYIY